MQAFVALGSNQGDPQRQVREAVQALGRLPRTRVLQRSPLYQTPPWGLKEQPDFVNAVAELDTGLTPLELLRSLLSIERAAGRHREGPRWGPRVLDLDLLTYGDHVRDEPGLTLPHPRIAERAFVLLPLADLAPGLEIPGQGRVADLLAAIDHDDCLRLPEPA